MNGYTLVFYVEIDLHILKSIWVYLRVSAKQKAEVDQEASEASGMQLFTAEVSGWKLLTIDVEGFVLDVMWSRICS